MKETFRLAFRSATFREDAILPASKTPLKQVLLFMLLYSLIAVLISSLISLPIHFVSQSSASISSILISALLTPAIYIVSTTIMLFIYHIFARIFGGIASFKDYYAALGLGGTAVNTIMVLPLSIPFLGFLMYPLVVFYQVALNIFIVMKVHSLQLGRAIAAVLIPTLIFAAIFFILVFLALSLMFSMW